MEKDNKNIAQQWIEAVTTKNGDKVVALLSETVIVKPPFQKEGVTGIQNVLAMFSAFVGVTENFRYGRHWETEGSVVMEFMATIDGEEVHAVDIATVSTDGKITQFEVLMRPAANALKLGKAVKEAIAAVRE